MTDKRKIKKLGLDLNITRRDFVNGIAVGALATLAPSSIHAMALNGFTPEINSAHYPPGFTGLRNDGRVFSAAHGRAWDKQTWDNPQETGEYYDVIIVGAGASGLAAAYSFRQKFGNNRRILLIDNHDDFGGHARRNEFTVDGETLLHPGGSVRLTTERVDGEMAAFLKELGIDVKAHRENQAMDPRNRAYDLQSGIYFDAERYGRDKTIVGDILPLGRKTKGGDYELLKYVDKIPATDACRQELKAFLTMSGDILSGLTDQQKEQKLLTISYRMFLSEMIGLSAESTAIFASYPKAITGCDIEAFSAWGAMSYLDMPGLKHLGNLGKKALREKETAHQGDPNIWFPDGNGSVSRLFVKKLIPDVSIGEATIDGIISQRFNYAKLDQENSGVRLRLNSTAVNVINTNKGVEVTYVRAGHAYKVTAKHCVMACYNMIVPHICPQVPKQQAAALSANVKVPLLSTNVLFRTGSPLLEIGAASFYCPDRLHTELIASGRNFGGHVQGLSDNKPATLLMMGVLMSDDKELTLKDRYRQGRHRMLAMSFEEIELEVREHLAGMLSSTSFDVKKDILAITVNRWGHGYSYESNPLVDPAYKAGEAPNEIARQRFGNIAIANSDSGGKAALEVAMKMGIRAVNDLAVV